MTKILKRVVFLVAASMALTPPPSSRAQSDPIVADAGIGPDYLAQCPSDLRYLNQLFGWQVSWPRQWSGLANADSAAVGSALTQWSTAPAALAAAEGHLRDRETIKAPRAVVERIVEQLDHLVTDLQANPPPLPDTVDAALRQRWTSLFTQQITPAVVRYRTFLRDEYLPASRPAPGFGDTPTGARCFQSAVETFTSLSITPDQVERIGNRIYNESSAQLAALYHRPVSEVPQILAELRAQRHDDFTRDDVVATSQAAIARARAAMPRMFTRPLQSDVTVQALPAAMEASFPAAAYRPAEGDTPPTFVVNLSRPGDRRLMAEVIAFHEAIPGHHVSFALGYPQGEFNSGFVEGWAIYAEYLADEMGLYSSDLDRAGMMTKHLWAASRLIVEPGIQLHGWTRERAIDYMRTHTALSDAEIALEVDRYISTPGQSLSYMLGYDVIMQARREAEQRMGARFDLRQFHDVVLSAGSRPLAQVRADVQRWSEAAHG